MIKDLELLELVGADLRRVEDKMRFIGSQAYAPLADAFLQLIDSGGKRLRPALALAAFGMFSRPVSEKAILMAAAIETLHTATLVHDDLIDGALRRRGISTLNATWNKGATVLAGDYMFARAAGMAAETENVPVVQLFAETLRVICEGELRQLLTSHQWNQPKEAYYQRIFAKTASLFAAATRSGAILAGALPAEETALYEFGEHLGMAFQIVDDVLDYSGDESALGKPVGGDLRQGIATLPFFYYVQSHDDTDRLRAILERKANGDGDGAAEIVSLIRGSDAIARSLDEARQFAHRAKERLSVAPAGPLKAALNELADFVVARHS